MKFSLALAIATLILTSCATTMNISKPESATVNPKGLSKDQLSKIVIDPKIALYSVDGKDYNLNILGSADTILIDAGVHTIEILIQGDLGYSTQRFPMQITVEPQKRYILKSSITGTNASANLVEWDDQVK